MLMHTSNVQLPALWIIREGIGLRQCQYSSGMSGGTITMDSRHCTSIQRQAVTQIVSNQVLDELLTPGVIKQHVLHTVG